MCGHGDLGLPQAQDSWKHGHGLVERGVSSAVPQGWRLNTHLHYSAANQQTHATSPLSGEQTQPSLPGRNSVLGPSGTASQLGLYTISTCHFTEGGGVTSFVSALVSSDVVPRLATVPSESKRQGNTSSLVHYCVWTQELTPRKPPQHLCPKVVQMKGHPLTRKCGNMAIARGAVSNDVILNIKKKSLRIRDCLSS